jgi:cytidine deaminase
MLRALRSEMEEGELKLIAEAEAAVLRALAPHTKVRIGAAVRTLRGQYPGCNIESVISGLGVCAERNAVNHAIIHEGAEARIVGVAVVRSGGLPVRPCGACLQYLSEFAPGNTRILMACEGSQLVEVSTIRELLPEAYRL